MMTEFQKYKLTNYIQKVKIGLIQHMLVRFADLNWWNIA